MHPQQGDLTPCEDLSLGTQIGLMLRLVVALLLGAVIGWERELQRMPAGFRTHSLVALGSAIFTVVSAYAFTGPGSDPTRIAAQIVSGIGFLGAGAILQYGGTVRGLTTAAACGRLPRSAWPPAPGSSSSRLSARCW